MDLATTMSPCYLPILRAKRGEIQALGALAPRVRRQRLWNRLYAVSAYGTDIVLV